MTSQIILIKINADNSLTRVVLDSENNVLQQDTVSGFANLPAAIKGVDSVILLSGQRLFSDAIAMPKTSRRNRRKALPYLLEACVLTPSAQLHCVTKSINKQHDQLVAIDKSLMNDYIKGLTGRGYYPRTMIPDYLVLPFERGNWTIFIDGDTAMVRTGFYSGFSTSVSHLKFLLKLAAKNHDHLIPCAVIANNPVDFSELEAQFSFSFIEEAAFDAHSLIKYPVINLLTGEFRIKNTASNHWCYAAGFFALWLLTLVTGKCVLWLHYQHQEAQLEQKIALMTKKLGSREEIIRQLQSAAMPKSSKLISLLVAVGEALSSVKQVSIQSIDFSGDRLFMTLQLQRLADFQQFAAQLEQKSLVITHNKITAGEKNMIATLTLNF